MTDEAAAESTTERRAHRSGANRTGLGLRFRNRKLARRVRLASKIWSSHLRRVAPLHYARSGRFAKLAGPIPHPGEELSARQHLLAMGAQVADTLSAHAMQSYEGAARLLTFQGGEPLPWPSMVLARTSLEASLRLMYLLDAYIPEEELLARVGAISLDDLNEHRKWHQNLSEEHRDRASSSNRAARDRIEGALVDVGLRVQWGDRGGGVIVTPLGTKASFPLNIFEQADNFMKPYAGFMYRWLCTFTHASPAMTSEPESGVAALKEGDAVVTLALLTDALWAGLDNYSRWVGMPNRLFYWAMRRVWSQLARRSTNGVLPLRAPDAAQSHFIATANEIERSGLMTKRALHRYRRNFIRRLDV